MKTYNVICKVCRSAAEFDADGKFVALHRETTQPLFLEFARLFTLNHKGKPFSKVKAALAKNGDTLTQHEIILLP